VIPLCLGDALPIFTRKFEMIVLLYWGVGLGDWIPPSPWTVSCRAYCPGEIFTPALLALFFSFRNSGYGSAGLLQ
jgi:hypothetical protein